jgi:hypothetical protein
MRTAPKELEAFGALQRTLAQATQQAVKSTVKTPWKELCFDVRSNPAGTTHSMKFRVTPVSGPRDAAFSHPFYGMKLTISCAGKCEVDFNYDPNCKEDPAFYGT